MAKIALLRYLNLDPYSDDMILYYLQDIWLKKPKLDEVRISKTEFIKEEESISQYYISTSSTMGYFIFIAIFSFFQLAG